VDVETGDILTPEEAPKDKKRYRLVDEQGAIKLVDPDLEEGISVRNMNAYHQVNEDMTVHDYDEIGRLGIRWRLFLRTLMQIGRAHV
jgi:hypothetical protein